MNQFNNWISTKALHSLPSGMVETFCRLMVYTEIEAFGIKVFMSMIIFLLFTTL